MSDCPYCTMLRCADDTVDLEKWKDHAARWHRLAMDYQAEIERLKNELTDMEDCKEALRQLGRYCGCDHCESSDERRVQVRHIKEAFAKRLTEIKRLQSELLFVSAESEKQDDEIERLNDEISFYESFADDDDATANWPHGDRRFRDWLSQRLREGDEARKAARWLYESDGDAHDKQTAREQWPWLKEVE